MGEAFEESGPQGGEQRMGFWHRILHGHNLTSLKLVETNLEAMSSFVACVQSVCLGESLDEQGRRGH